MENIHSIILETTKIAREDHKVKFLLVALFPLKYCENI